VAAEALNLAKKLSFKRLVKELMDQLPKIMNYAL
jgi:hypothetical protein